MSFLSDVKLFFEIRKQKNVLKKCNQWLLTGEVGESSKYLCSIASGTPLKNKSHPYDPSDFQRCINFLRLFSDELQDKILVKAATESKQWEKLYINWHELLFLYNKEKDQPSAHELYKRMHEILFK